MCSDAHSITLTNTTMFIYVCALMGDHLRLSLQYTTRTGKQTLVTFTVQRLNQLKHYHIVLSSSLTEFYHLALQTFIISPYKVLSSHFTVFYHLALHSFIISPYNVLSSRLTEFYHLTLQCVILSPYRVLSSHLSVLSSRLTQFYHLALQCFL